MQHSEIQTRDIPLAARLAAGDSIAFQHIYNCNRKRVSDLAYKYLKCAETAREVTQDVFKTVWEKREQFGFVKNLDAFIFTIARNRAITYLNRRAHDTKVLSRYAQSVKDNFALSPDMIVQDSENARLLDEVIYQRLTDRQREVFLLSRDFGKSHQEIAGELSIARNTVNNHIKDSLKLIRSTFGLD